MRTFSWPWTGIQNGTYGGVCVWKLDRLTRRFTEYATIIRQLEQASALLLSVEDNIQTDTAMGQAIVGILAAQAQTESENTSLRVAAAEESNARLGKAHGGGKRCFGYDRTEGGGLSINEAEAKQLRQVAQWLKTGLSLRAVTQLLNELGSVTTTGRLWSRQSLAQTLKSPKLRGIRIHKGREYPGNWEPIFSESEHLELLQLVSSGYKQSPLRRENQSLLSGLVRCGTCGRKLYRSKIKNRDGSNHWRYACQKQPGLHSCGTVSITMDSLDKYVVGCAIEYEDQHGPDVAVLDRAEQDRAAYQEDARLVDEAKLADLLRDQFLNRESTYSRDIYDEIHAELNGRIRLHRAELDVLKSQLSQRRNAELMLRRTTDLPWHPSQPISTRRAWIRQYVGQIVIHPALIRGAKFDPRRIQIEWKLGEYVPDDTDDSILAGQWNQAEEVLRSLGDYTQNLMQLDHPQQPGSGDQQYGAGTYSMTRRRR